MEGFQVPLLPPSTDCETTAILKALNRASRALGQLKGVTSKIPNSQILIDTLVLQEAKDSNEIENIITMMKYIKHLLMKASLLLERKKL